MDIFINRTSSAVEKKAEQRHTATQEKKKDRRRSVRDRRKSVNEGLVVSLSVRNERRSHRERRQHSGLETGGEPSWEEVMMANRTFSVIA